METVKGVINIDILQVIEELEAVAVAGTKVPGLRRKVMIDVDRLKKVVEELHTSIPSDIQEAKEILRQKESIINQSQLESRRLRESAMEEADAVIGAARQEQETRVDETEIVRSAQSRAEEIMRKAEEDAQQIAQDAQQRAYRIVDEAEAAATGRRDGADQYARETLFDIEERLSAQLGQVRRGIDALGVTLDRRVPASSTNGS